MLIRFYSFNLTKEFICGVLLFLNKLVKMMQPIEFKKSRGGFFSTRQVHWIVSHGVWKFDLNGIHRIRRRIERAVRARNEATVEVVTVMRRRIHGRWHGLESENILKYSAE